jgi:signal transduction histidine kinase
MMVTVLAVSAEADVRKELERLLTGDGHQVLLAHSAEAALLLLAEKRPALLLGASPSLPDGLALLRRLRLEIDPAHPGGPVLLLASDAPEALPPDLAPEEYLTWPGPARELLARVHLLLRVRRLEDELEQARRERDAFIAMVCHELKNPLASAQAAADLIQRRLARGETLHGLQPLLERISRQSHRMAGLLDQLQEAVRGGTMPPSAPSDSADS